MSYMAYDGLVVLLAVCIALELRFGGRVPADYLERLPLALCGFVISFVSVNQLTHMYWRGWRYAGVQDALALSQAVAIGSVLALAFLVLNEPADHLLPISIVPLCGLIALGGMGVARFRIRIAQSLTGTRVNAGLSRTLIVGAGQAGQRLTRELLSVPGLGYRPVCLVDDDPGKVRQRVHGLLIAGTRHDIQQLVRRHNIETVVIAIPSLPAHERRDIMARCQLTAARIMVVPGLPELLSSSSERLPLRDVRPEDLLGRDPVRFADSAYGRWLDSDATVLITGAAGSIGSELSRQVAAAGVGRMLLLDNNESGLFELAAELQSAAGKSVDVEVVVADVTRIDRLLPKFQAFRPDTVFHAAAYKHVPLMEGHPGEAVSTNVVGTYNVCVAAEAAKCKRVVFISTDKAVDPVNIMGASKRVGEHIVCAFAANTSTIYCAVRFGNVLGSRGSVVPIFDRQIRAGGPVTVTDRNATRFFMTIPEASSLVIEASCFARGGEIFILDMGQSVRIVDLAYKMIRMHGLRPDVDVKIQEVGLRPGEKLHESLMTAGEELLATPHPRVRQVAPSRQTPVDRDALVGSLDALKKLTDEGTTASLTTALFALAREGTLASDWPRGSFDAQATVVLSR